MIYQLQSITTASNEDLTSNTLSLEVTKSGPEHYMYIYYLYILYKHMG